jgi:hypothetical protein
MNESIMVPVSKESGMVPPLQSPDGLHHDEKAQRNTNWNGAFS